MLFLRRNVVVRLSFLRLMFSGEMLQTDDHERTVFVGHLRYTVWVVVCSLFFSNLFSPLIHKTARESGYRILSEKEELLLEGEQEGTEGQLETKQARFE